jgi:predicted O-linked N-acetylglucosamine transferase (SPINDLY family)
MRNRAINIRSTFRKHPLKIGYLTDCLKLHSVGWLVRWTLQYHDPDVVDVYTYSTYNPKDFIHDQLIEKYGDHVRHIDYLMQKITDQIQLDEIDILVDLGSLTEFQNCVVTAIKPAPIQITWLGMDASGIPAVDYYIADRFALPDDAQDYYSEKLIKMPHCYIAVDGFECDRPSVSRTDFGIPEHGVIYLSSQGGAKRHPDNMKLQVQILAQVPNSYLLIKGMKTDEAVILQSFTKLAVSLGVESDRIKIMPATLKEENHRANLKIADVILDTYPYNGATTTLEALWCEIPLVTRVGQQFAARNSYSMLMNAGVTEGIAWTDEEYVAWGVALGLNRDLRDRVRWKLRQSKRTSPLWDARQFTRDLEAVYQQVWERYLVSI